MSAGTPTLDRAPERPADAPAPDAATPLLRCLRFELLKQAAQWRVRILLLLCLVLPAAFIAIVSNPSSAPADAVFGRQMPMTGWAGAAVMLTFACTWALPLLTALIAGDVFASEDRLGTWRHLMVAIRSTRTIFAAKALASALVLLALVLLLALSAILGGLLVAGNHPLTGLDGHQLSGGEAAGRVLLAWLCVLAPTAAFGAVGLLGSVLFGRSPIGLALPALLSLALAFAQLLPLPVAVRLALPSQSLIAWRGLFTAPAQTGPVLAGIAVCAVWTLVATATAYLVFVRRDFSSTTYDGTGRRTLVAVVLPLGALVIAGVMVLTLAGAGTGSGITRPKLEDGLATSFGHLYRLQLADLHRDDATEAQIAATARCLKGTPDVPDEGAGNDWRCIVTWHVPGSPIVGHATYQLDVTADGKFVADGDGPKEVNGSFQVRTPTGDAPNPLWRFDGLVDLLAPRM